MVELPQRLPSQGARAMSIPPQWSSLPLPQRAPCQLSQPLPALPTLGIRIAALMITPSMSMVSAATTPTPVTMMVSARVPGTSANSLNLAALQSTRIPERAAQSPRTRDGNQRLSTLKTTCHTLQPQDQGWSIRRTVTWFRSTLPRLSFCPWHLTCQHRQSSTLPKPLILPARLPGLRRPG